MTRAGGIVLVVAGLAAPGLAAYGLLPAGGMFAVGLLLALTFAGGSLLFAVPALGRPAGIANDDNFRSPIRHRGIPAYLLFFVLAAFYVVIYRGAEIPLGASNLNQFFQRHVYSIFDPVAVALRGRGADNWFFYSLIYTYFVLLFGLRMLFRYRHNRYQLARTFSVMAVQLLFGFSLPALLVLFQQPEFYFSYFWPLKYEYLQPTLWAAASGPKRETLLLYFLTFALALSFIGVPLLTYLVGKRWYCSWICGCGGLAETAGDPFRHLSSKSLPAWRIERWSIHAVLVLIVVTTLLLWINLLAGGGPLGKYSARLAHEYGFWIGFIFSGLVGVGLYPLLGSRIWCRFGCPLAALLGLVQRFFSRFRITTNGGQCISCGNCSAYCEMGIDVRWYAQRGQNIVRASCVGCGICAAVCPRGVLRLENGSTEGRINL